MQDPSEQKRCVLNYQRTAVFGSIHWADAIHCSGLTVRGHLSCSSSITSWFGLQNDDQQCWRQFPSFHRVRRLEGSHWEDSTREDGNGDEGWMETMRAGYVGIDGPRWNSGGKVNRMKIQEGRRRSWRWRHHYGSRWSPWTPTRRILGGKSDLAGKIQSPCLLSCRG